MELIMLALFIVAFALGIMWAKKNIISDVEKLYSTRPLNESQIEQLNKEVKELATELKK